MEESIEQSTAVNEDTEYDYAGISDEELFKLPIEDIMAHALKSSSDSSSNNYVNEDNKDSEKDKQEQSDEDAVPVEDSHTTEEQPDMDSTVVKEQPDSKADSDSLKADKYKEFYDKANSISFKANGKKVTIEDPEDLISLAQQGVDYRKKTQELAPIRKLSLTLEKEGITENDLSLLIDVYNGDVEATKALLKRSKIDPLDLDLEQTLYTPKNNLVTDTEVAFKNVADTIAKSPYADKVYNTLKSWDKASVSHIYSNPLYLENLNNEVGSERFDTIQERMDKDRFLGRNEHLLDLDLYGKYAEQYDKEHSASTKPKEVEKVNVKKDLDVSKNGAKLAKSGSTRSAVTFEEKLSSVAKGSAEYDRILEKELGLSTNFLKGI